MSVTIVIERIAKLVRRANSALTNQRTIHARRQTRAAFTRRYTTGLPNATRGIVDNPVAIVVNPVADLRGRSDVADTVRAPARLRTLSTLARRTIHLTAWRSRWNTCCRRNTFVGLSVAIVVDTVANFGCRTVRARRIRIASHARARGPRRHVFLRTSQLTRAVGWRCLSTSYGCNSFVDDPVAIVIASVADFLRRHATRTHVFIRLSVAIVVLAIANLGRRTMERTAAPRHPVVDLTIAVVIVVVADFFRIVTQPRRRIRLLPGVVDTWQQRHVARGIARRNARLIIGQTRRALRRSRPRAARRIGIAIMRIPLVRTTIAIVVRVIAGLRRHAPRNDRGQCLRQLRLVRRRPRRRRPTSRRNVVQRRCRGSDEPNDVDLDLEGLPPKCHPRTEETARFVHRETFVIRIHCGVVVVTCLVAVRDQNHVDCSARSLALDHGTNRRGYCCAREGILERTRKVLVHIEQHAAQRRSRCCTELTVAAEVVDVAQDVADVRGIRRQRPVVILKDRNDHVCPSMHVDSKRRFSDDRTATTAATGRIFHGTLRKTRSRTVPTRRILAVDFPPRVRTEPEVDLPRKRVHRVSHGASCVSDAVVLVATRVCPSRDRGAHRTRCVDDDHEVGLRRCRPLTRIGAETRGRFCGKHRVRHEERRKGCRSEQGGSRHKRTARIEHTGSHR